MATSMASPCNLRCGSPSQTQQAISLAMANPNHGSSESSMKPCTEFQSKRKASTKNAVASLPSRSTPSLQKHATEKAPIAAFSSENNTRLKDIRSLGVVDSLQKHIGAQDMVHFEESMSQAFPQGDETANVEPSAKKAVASSTPSLQKFLIGVPAAPVNATDKTPIAAFSSENNTKLKDVRSLEVVDSLQKHAGVQEMVHFEESMSQAFLQGDETANVEPSAKKSSKKRGRPRCLFSSSQAEDSSDNLKQLPSCAKEQMPLKRKRFALKLPLDSDSKAETIELCRSEIASLRNFYDEQGKLEFKEEHVHGGTGALLRADIALLLEESPLPFSTLVETIFKKLSQNGNRYGLCELTLASTRSTVLSIAERVCYGVAKPDADVLEDNSESCLWCWEVRDLKLLPESHRDNIAIRRRRRRKIADRLCALAVMMSILSHEDMEDMSHLCKAKENLEKIDDEFAIRACVARWIDRQNSKRWAKESKMKEKDALKEQQRLNRESEREQRRLHKEAEKTLLLQEKEKKRQEKEANKQQARAHKEASRQEQSEKELKRREKEAAELKRQAALQKQATILDRFLQSKKDCVPLSSNCDAEGVCQTGKQALEEIVAKMDKELNESSDKQSDELFRFHISSWKNFGKPYGSRKIWWGLRRLPKISVSRELCLQKTSGEAASCENLLKHDMVQVSGSKRPRKDSEDDELRLDKLDMDWENSCAIINDCFIAEAKSDGDRYLLLRRKRRKLLQFDKSYRPAYYGTFSKKSHFIKPRNPFTKDPNLDYENDSDEEWEEEDPGESLSDCDKDEEDDKADIEEEDEADGFVVPDGYLSENEGVHLEDVESDDDNEFIRDAPNVPAAGEGILDSQSLDGNNPDLQIIERQQKLLESVTDQALKCNRAFIISNLAKDGCVTTMSRTERICIQALRIQVISEDVTIEPPREESPLNSDVPQYQRQKKEVSPLPDSILSELVEILSSSSKSLNKTIDILSTKFPSASKSQLRSKIREVAEFVDNHWQVKKDVVEQLGLKTPCNSASCLSDTVGKPHAIHLKPITKFFSKRCLPPEEAEQIAVPIYDGNSDKNVTKGEAVS